jgi:hypothetical protein
MVNYPRSFAFPLVEGSTGFLVTNDPAGSQLACATKSIALLSAPLQDGVGFLKRSVAHTLSASLAVSLPPKRKDVGFTMFHSNNA